LRGKGKVDAGCHGQEFDGADLAASVPSGGVAVGVGVSASRAGRPVGGAGRLVAFDGQDPVRAAPVEVGDVVALAVQRISGDHHTVQVSDLVEEDIEEPAPPAQSDRPDR
jgi:hypothetical protein